MNYEWVQPTLERISDLLRMPAIHNSYGTPKIDPKLAWDAINWAWSHTNPYTPAPRISPTLEGGLRLLWSGTETEISLIANPGVLISVHVVKGALRPGDFATVEEILEEGLRQIDMELDPARSETPKP